MNMLPVHFPKAITSYGFQKTIRCSMKQTSGWFNGTKCKINRYTMSLIGSYSPITNDKTLFVILRNDLLKQVRGNALAVARTGFQKHINIDPSLSV